MFPISSVPQTGADCHAMAVAGLEDYSPDLASVGLSINWAPRTTFQKDDQSVPTRGLSIANSFLNGEEAVGIIGPWNSAVGDPVGSLSSAMGIPMIGAISSPALAFRRDYSSIYMAAGNDVQSFVGGTDVLVHYNWKRVGVITTDDEYALAGTSAFREAAPSRDIVVEGFYVVPLGLKKLGRGEEAKTALREFIKADIRVILVFGVPNDAATVLEQADDLGMLANPTYQFVGPNDWGSDNFIKSAWTRDKAKLVGIIAFEKRVDTSSNEFKKAAERFHAVYPTLYADYNSSLSPDITAVAMYDATRALMTALKKAAQRLTELGISLDCFKFSMRNKNSACLLPTSERDSIYNLATTTQNEGLLAYMVNLKDASTDTFGINANSPLALVAKELYTQNITGGAFMPNIAFTDSGFTPTTFNIKNIQFSGTGRDTSSQWTIVGVLGSSITMDSSATVQFPGGTAAKPNTTPLDLSETQATAGSSGGDDTLMFIAISIGCIVILVVVVGLMWFLKIRKRSRIGEMLWLIPFEEVTLSSRETTALGESPSLNSELYSLDSGRPSLSGVKGINANSKPVPESEIAKYKGNSVRIFKHRYRGKKLTKATFESNSHLRKLVFTRQELNNLNINPFIGMVVDDATEDLNHHGHIFVLEGCCEKGSLHGMILNPKMSLDTMFIYSIAIDIAKGIQYLQKSDLCFHGNLKSSNCLLDSRWTCRLSGFGLECILDSMDPDDDPRTHTTGIGALGRGSKSWTGGDKLFLGYSGGDENDNDIMYDWRIELLWTAPELLGAFKQRHQSRWDNYAKEFDVADTVLSEMLANKQSVSITNHGSTSTVRSKLSALTSDRGSFHFKKRSILKHSIDYSRMGSEKGDVYSFGLIVLQMLSRKLPYCGDDNGITNLTILLEKIENKSFHNRGSVTKAQKKNEQIVQLSVLIDSWLSFDPDERPPIRTCCAQLKTYNPNRGSSLTDSMTRVIEKYAKELENLVEERTEELRIQTEQTRTLLFEILPPDVANSLIAGHPVEPSAYVCVTVFFSDIVGFTEIAGSSTPIEVIKFLNALYTCFDHVLAQYDVYKVETIGDAYMVASGLPNPNGCLHVKEICSMALQLRGQATNFVIPHRSGSNLKLRCGVHSGPVVAGVVGLKMPRYCLFGDTVNTASRMESNGEALKIHPSSAKVQPRCCNRIIKAFS
eukprot:Nk52_evm75s208 gene=Nk52_evmTU75s208